MEANFNAANKIIYGNRMLQTVQNHNLMPEEIFSEQGKTPVESTLSKIPFYDISRQLRLPAAIASVNASNCFDRICHAIASLAFQSTGVPPLAVKSMLHTIEEMKFFSALLSAPHPLSQAAVSTSKHRVCAKGMERLLQLGAL